MRATIQALRAVRWLVQSRSAKEIFTLGLLSVALSSCTMFSPQPVPPQQVVMDQWGCDVPPPDIFTKAGVDLNFAQSTLGKVVVGTIDVKVKPEVVSLASSAMIDERIVAYQRCLSLRRDKFTPEQAAYMEKLRQFMRAQPPPTPDQFIKYQQMFPFPGEKPKTLAEVPDIDRDGFSMKGETAVVSKAAGVYELTEDLKRGDCLMAQGSRVQFSSDGKASFNLRVRTTFTRNRDIWHQSWLIKDTFYGEFHSPELRNGEPFKVWTGTFTYTGPVPTEPITWRSRC